MAYYFYLDDMMLPIPPAKMDIRIKNKNKTVNLINEGEINIIKTEGLKEISFELLCLIVIIHLQTIPKAIQK